MNHFDYLNFIIDYQLELAVDYDNTVNNLYYEKKIDDYFKLIHNNKELIKEDESFIEKAEIESLKRKRIDDNVDYISRRPIKYINEHMYLQNAKPIIDNSVDSSEESIYYNSLMNTYPQYKTEIMNGGLYKFFITDAFALIENDIKRTPKEFTFFKEGSDEYEKVNNFINLIVNYNKLEESSNRSNFFTFDNFTNLIAKLSFKLPTLTPNSKNYKKILNYIYLCLTLYDEAMFKKCNNVKIVNKCFNNSIVPYTFELFWYYNDGFTIERKEELNMNEFKGSCTHIASLLSIALELGNCHLLRDFVAIQLYNTFKFNFDVSKMSMNILIILSDLLLNKGNLNIYCCEEIITYNKVHNEIIFSRSFDDNIIKELKRRKKNLVISRQKYPTLIEINKEEYSIDYTKVFFRRFLKIILYLNTIKDSSDLLGYFKIETYDTDNPVLNTTDNTVSGFRRQFLQCPWYYFNFSEDFILSVYNHSILMKIIDRDNCVYKIIDPNWKDPNEHDLTFKIKRTFCGDVNKIVYSFDEQSINNLNLVIKTIKRDAEFKDFYNSKDGIEITPITVFYGIQKSFLTPILFPLNKSPNPPNLIENNNTRLYIGNGICIKHDGNLLLTSDNYSDNLFKQVNMSKFDNLKTAEFWIYSINFDYFENEVDDIKKKIKSLKKIKGLQTTGGLFEKYYNLSKYLIIILIFIVVIIIIIFIVRLVVNKNKNDNIENFNYNK